MKYFVLSVTGLLMFAYSITVVSAERYHAHYEVNVDDGNSVKTVRTSCFMTSGTPIVNEMGENNLSLTIEVDQASEYTLTVALTPMVAAASSDAPLVSQSFTGQLARQTKGPLEFSMNKDGLKIYGAIGLSSLNQ